MKAQKRWIIQPVASETQKEQEELLQGEILVPPAISKLLVQRGITSYEKAKEFFRPDLNGLHDPFLMQDMDLAVDRIKKAFGNNEKILVYGDYDVDGSTAVALLYDFIRQIYKNVDFYIPDRYTEGYGISWQSIDWAEENGFGLIVALDCGIKSLDKVEAARQRGIDFIVCDHHRPGEELPAAVAVLDPKRTDCPYPYKELTGCGIGFKLAQAICKVMNLPGERALSYLDLVMISTAADIVPIKGENRILAFHGLKALNTAPRTGIKALMNVAGLNNEVSITQVVFGLAPRINAAGRIHHAHEAVKLILATDAAEAEDFAREINRYNTDRRDLDTSITDDALLMIAQDEWLKNASSTVLFQETWHKGVIGIVASRCIEHYHRPTIIFTQSNGKATGSARSVPGFDLYEAIEECAELLEQFGGHTFAAGMTLPVENVTAFREKFDQVVKKRILPEQLVPSVAIDLELSFSDISPKFFRLLNQMAPFGPENLPPVFVSHQLKLNRKPLIMKGKHLKMEVCQDGIGPFGAVAFGAADLLDQLESDQPFSMCYTVEENVFRGKRTLQMMVKDIRITSH